MSRFSTPRSTEPRRTTTRAAIILLLTGGAITCSADAHKQPRALAASHQIIADVVVTVSNGTSREKQIYLVARQIRHTLGAVSGHSSRSFSVPSGAGDSTSALLLEADDGGASRVQRSDVFHLASGQRAVWTIAGNGGGVLTMR